jgi:hypothetical protein
MNNSPIEERPPRHTPFRTLGWGAALILLGVVFLLRNVGWLELNGNWWALFILLPVSGIFFTAWQRYQRLGRLTSGIVSSLLGGCVLLFVMAVFLFNLNWGTIWPVFLIIGGLGALALSWVARK